MPMKLIFKIVLLLYLIVGIIPNLDALDRVVTQWLYLNILNTFVLFFLVIKGYPLKKYFLNKTSILFFALFIWSTISMFFAINRVESIVVLSQLFAIVIAFIITMICLSKIEKPFKFISNVISIYLILELLAIYYPFATEAAKTQIFSRSSLFLGFAANVNITAFSIIYKIPFLIYSILQLKKFKSLSFIFSFVIFSLIIFASGTLNSTRSAIITYTTLAPILFIISLVTYFKSKEYKLLVISIIYSLSVILSYPINSYISNSFGKSEKNITNRISSLSVLIEEGNLTDQSINERRSFYSQASSFIIKNPFFGTGIGNWKIKSIDTNKENIVGYLIPYHVHNDYLEIAAEIGLIGLGIYLLILFFAFKNETAKFFRIIFTKVKLDKNYLKCIIISLFFYIFLIDSNLNFPFHRPIVLINLIVLIAYLNSESKINVHED